MNDNLRACPSCNQEIAKSAQTCPHCGKTFTPPLAMIFAIIFVIIALVKIFA